MNRLTLRQQFMTVSILILACTMAASLLTWGGSLVFLIKSTEKFLNPANYYENQIPAIFAFIDQRQEDILDPALQSELEEVIPTEGIDYQIVDRSGEWVYGTWQERTINNREELLKKINTSSGDGGKYVRFYPIVGARQELQGAIVLRYGLNLSSANPNRAWFVVSFIFGNLVAPLVYFTLFTFLFGRWLGNRVEPHIAALIQGAKRIERQDLNFSMQQVNGAKELAELGGAFERMRHTLQETLIREWRSEEERREMVAAITHDLRTPLTIIQGHVEGLIDSGAKQRERLERYLETIRSNTERSIQLLAEMTELSDIERPDFTLMPSDVDIAVFVSQKKEEFSVLCQQKQIVFRATYRDFRQEAEPLRFDAARLSRILDNVMMNSVRFAPEYGEITWYTRVREGKVEFEFIDSGPGFSEKDLRLMFQRFYQGDPSRSAGKGHAGLGLSIAHTLVQKHGGDMRAKNAPGGGALVRLWVRELE